MCSCELIPIHYDDFVLFVRRCAAIQHLAEHVVSFLFCFVSFLFFHAFNKTKHGLSNYVVLIIKQNV